MKEEALRRLFSSAQELLEAYNTDFAAFYFWYVAEQASKAELLDLAATSYEKAAYCYDLEDKIERAVELNRAAAVLRDRKNGKQS